MPLVAYGLEEAVSIGTLLNRHVIFGSSVGELAESPIKLRFRFKNAKLFSFQFQ